ncbi:MAG: hypothetical protein JWP03_1868, partial [Phycisphaerales bacterium]|nr:hypothetical protein [Phycisphaerales bacterium]
MEDRSPGPSRILSMPFTEGLHVEHPRPALV